MKNTIELTREEARRAVYDDHENFTTVLKEIIDTRRWVSENEVILKRISDGTYWRGYYTEALTEAQEARPFDEYNGDKPIFTQVEQVEVVTKVWKEVEA